MFIIASYKSLKMILQKNNSSYSIMTKRITLVQDSTYSHIILSVLLHIFASNTVMFTEYIRKYYSCGTSRNQSSRDFFLGETDITLKTNIFLFEKICLTVIT